MSELIPANWNEKTLDAVCDISGGGTPDRSNAEYWNGNIPWASPTEITKLKTRYIDKTSDSLTELGLAKSSAKLLPEGSILVTTRATLGYAAINIVPMATNQGFQSLQCKKHTNNEFIYQLIIATRPELKRISAGSTFAEISSSNFKKIRVLIPPLPEQKKIATILTSVDTVIEKTQAQIDKLNDLKTGMMQELLTKGIGPDGKPHTEFKDSPVGRIPVGWDVASVLDVCRNVNVGVVVKPTQYYVEEGVPALRSANVRETGLTTKNLKFFSNESNKILEKSMIRTGDLLTVRTGYPGTTAVVTKEFDRNNCIDVIITRPSEKIDSVFLAMWVNSDFGKGQVLKMQGGLAQQHFNVGDMEKLLVPVPELKEQKRISKTADAFMKRIKVQKDKLDQVKKIKKALMQDLLTGKVRVTPDPE